MYNESIIISKIEYSKLFGEFFMNHFYKEIHRRQMPDISIVLNISSDTHSKSCESMETYIVLYMFHLLS
jgi:hypothetical protein